MTVLLYLIGKVGTGKYTIANEIAKDDYILCDNHLINNPIFSLLQYDGFAPIPPFAWKAIEGIRASVFTFLSQELYKNYVLTNVPYENEGDCRLFNKVEQTAHKRGSVFIPVRLGITQEENMTRIQNPQRKERYKSTDIQYIYPPYSLINLNHPHLLDLEVTTLTASQVAKEILKHVDKIKGNHGPMDQAITSPKM